MTHVCDRQTNFMTPIYRVFQYNKEINQTYKNVSFNFFLLSGVFVGPVTQSV